MIGKNLLFISKLPTYTLKHTAIRMLLVGFTGFLFLFIAVKFSPVNTIEITSVQYLRVILIFIIGSEINVFLDNVAEHFFPIPEKIGLRIAMHLVFSVLFAWVAVVYFESLMDSGNLLKEPVVKLMLVLGGIFIFILLVVSVGLRITEKWIQSVNELEELKQVKLMGDYNALQDQLNPHFLFNNLSILKSMIIYDQKAAVEFTQNFTDFYRYVLQSSGKTTVRLKDEIELLRSFIAIHKERLGDNLQIKIDIGDAITEKNIPPLSLQLLVENAIKHNIAGKENPLVVEIFSDENTITVKNNLQPKESSYSTRNGLKNLVQRYKILSEKEIVITQNNSTFAVQLPLL
ncbi:MAG TPA: histidine kinase [Draconibacterium sp.]|nr:histidine kinase [Draconibacterium sp.]